MKKVYLIILIIFSVNSLPGEEIQKWGDSLFPETKTWKEVSKLPIAEVGNLKLKFPEENNYKDCDIAKKTKEKYSHNFFVYDVNHDKQKDIIYSGQNPCSEGDITVYWAGPRFQEVFVFPASRNARLLKIGPDKKDFLAVKLPCCDMEETEYIKNGGDNLISLYNQTMLPVSSFEKPIPFTSKKELHLRSWPKVKDDYNELSSKHLMTAVFGNNLSKYLPGSTGRILYSHMVTKDEKWNLVIMDKSIAYLRYYFMSPSVVGWVKADEIED